jgi:ankyrin repeat protein
MDKTLLLFYHACIVGSIEIIESLLESDTNLDINPADEDGDTALHKAVLFDHYDMVKYLLDLGCSKNKKNNYGWTALDMAIVDQNVSIGRLLHDYGATEFSVDKQWFYDVLYNKE